MARAGAEVVAESQRAELGIAPGAAAGDRQSAAVHLAASCQCARAVGAVVDINDTPLTVEALPVGATVAGAAAIIHIQHCDAAAGPVELFEIEACEGRAGGPTMAHHQQRRALATWCGVVTVARWVEEGVGG